MLEVSTDFGVPPVCQVMDDGYLERKMRSIRASAAALYLSHPLPPSLQMAEHPLPFLPLSESSFLPFGNNYLTREKFEPTIITDLHKP